MVVRQLEMAMVWAAVLTICFGLWSLLIHLIGEVILQVVEAIGG